MEYTILIRTLKGEVKPGKAVIVSANSLKNTLCFGKEFIEYFIKQQYKSYDETLKKVERLNKDLEIER